MCTCVPDLYQSPYVTLDQAHAYIPLEKRNPYASLWRINQVIFFFYI